MGLTRGEGRVCGGEFPVPRAGVARDRGQGGQESPCPRVRRPSPCGLSPRQLCPLWPKEGQNRDACGDGGKSGCARGPPIFRTDLRRISEGESGERIHPPPPSAHTHPSSLRHRSLLSGKCGCHAKAAPPPPTPVLARSRLAALEKTQGQKRGPIECSPQIPGPFCRSRAAHQSTPHTAGTWLSECFAGCNPRANSSD
jgi:hypothetical protein